MSAPYVAARLPGRARRRDFARIETSEPEMGRAVLIEKQPLIIFVAK